MHLLILLSLLTQDPVFPDTDPQPAIEAAKKKAAENNRVVLVVWGRNDDEKSRDTAAMLKKNKDVARVILYEYDLVLADAMKAPPGMWEEPILPKFFLYAADGSSKFHKTPADPKAMVEFLKKNQRPPLDAKEVLAAAKKKAEKEKKRVLLTFGAPT